MKIGLDTRATDPRFKAHCGRGIGRYTTHLVSEIEKLSSDVQLLDYDYFEISHLQQLALDVAPFGKQTLRNQIFAGSRLKFGEFDAIHFPSHLDAPVFGASRCIVTVHDLIPLKFPELYNAEGSWRFRLARRLDNMAIEKALGVIADSESTKRDLIEILGVSEAKIRVVELGVDSKRFEQDCDLKSPRNVLEGNGVVLGEDKLLLYVGGIDARKNVDFLIELVAHLSQETTQSWKLILAGRLSSDEDHPKLLEALGRIESDRVVLIDGANDQTLIGLYKLADVFVFASLYEGFGLPILEAMSAGLGVVAAKNSSIVEVTDKYGALVDGYDVRDWASAILQTNTAGEGQLTAARDWARMFSWEKTARKTLESYEYFLGERFSQEEFQVRAAAGG